MSQPVGTARKFHGLNVGLVLCAVLAGGGYVLWRSSEKPPALAPPAPGTAAATDRQPGLSPDVVCTAALVPGGVGWPNFVLAGVQSLLTQDMAWIPGGEFRMGDDFFADARPVHTVRVHGFWMDRHPVTNAEFGRFVKATGYVTLAERTPDPKNLPPGSPPEFFLPGGMVFTAPDHDVPLDQSGAWWRYVPGACWRQPEGPGSDLTGREQHPVVQIGWDDATAFARWAGKRLPTEAEREFAARGGLDGKAYCWGDELKPEGKWMANVWQGRFPRENTCEDGFAGTAPVGSYPPNGYGLYDMAGNVWEWCLDWYRPDYYHHGPVDNPRGPDSSFDPRDSSVPKRVQRGGSFLCSDVYCVRYRVGGRGKGPIDSASSHAGFRCIRPAR